MDLQPSREVFRARYAAARPQVVWTRLPADLDTPVSAMMKLADGHAHSFLLESVEGGAVRGRYSGIGLLPDLVWRCRDGVAALNRQVRHDPDAWVAETRPPLDSLRALIAESRIDLPSGLPAMAAGLIGYMGYDMARQMERLPATLPDRLDIPDAVFMRPTVMAVFDNVDGTVLLVAPVWPAPGLDAAVAQDLARERLANTIRDLDRQVPRAPDPGPVDGAVDSAVGQPEPNMSQAAFEAMVARARDHIRAGEVFQVLPSQRFSMDYRLPPFALYRSLRRLNPSPFLFFFNAGGLALVGSSPEIMVRLRGGRVTLRPLAGTRPRGRDRAADAALEAALLADPKERAEHLMLLDLGRNDVGRVAKIGSVRVTESFQVERYSHVMHIVSEVVGELADGEDALSALIAGFPAGTVSGAPKIRAMQIIDELEPDRRGVYAGAVGYFSANGDMDTCIALRTALVRNGRLHVQAGAGVVADSVPAAEYRESCDKARALIRAARESVRFARGFR